MRLWSPIRNSIAVALLSLVAAGCNSPVPNTPAPAAAPSLRQVKTVRPERKTIHREVGQPGVIQAFERTPIVSRIPGYVLKWNADIGDSVQKDAVLAELSVPEMHSELKLKEEVVEQAKKSLAMAQAQIATAKAQIQEATAAVAKADANHNYWKSQAARFAGLVNNSVLDKQTQEETLNQFRSAAASLSEAQAKVQSAEALQQEKESARDKAEADIRAADADRRRQADMVAYATLKAPYDGVITQRNINTRQFVQPTVGEKGDVLYVIQRTDVVRVFVSVPETDADWVHVGSPATIRVQALRGQEFHGQITRTSWSLNRTTRTLLTEIDLPNPEVPRVGRRMRPGMYAYATVTAEWRDVLTVPTSAVMTDGDVNVGYTTYCYLLDAGKAKRTPIEVGARNDQLVEVLKKQVPAAGPGDEPRWEQFRGDERIILGRPDELSDGQEVRAD
jgi:multidrug resistance efflux pump